MKHCLSCLIYYLPFFSFKNFQPLCGNLIFLLLAWKTIKRIINGRAKIWNRPFATNGHMVQNPPCWRASSLLFPHWDVKTKRPQPVKVDWPLFECPSAGIIMSLPSSMADFVTCDRLLQKAYSFNSISHEQAQLFYTSNLKTLRKRTWARNDFTLFFFFIILNTQKMVRWLWRLMEYLSWWLSSWCHLWFCKITSG